MIRERRLPSISPAERPVVVLVAAWVLAMISIPILRWTFGDDVLPAGISLGVLLQVIAVSLIVISAWGVRRGLLTLGVIVALAWLTEYVGSTTDFPFGSYDYTARLQPQVGGVPLLIPLAWLMMLPPAWAVAGVIVPSTAGGSKGFSGTQWSSTRRRGFQPQAEVSDKPFAGWGMRVRFVVVSALAFTAWDLFLDPQMVAWDLWRWSDPGALNYFGIPFVNYAGWLLASSVITVVAAWIAPLHRLPARPLLIIYGITWALETIGLAVFWGLPAPALVGCLGMGAILLWTWRARRKVQDG